MENQTQDQKGMIPDWKPDGENAANRSPQPAPPAPPAPPDMAHTSENTGMQKTPHSGNAISSAMLGGVGMKR